METSRGEAKEANGCENHKGTVVSLKSSEVEDQVCEEEEEEEESESQCLLPPPRKGGMMSTSSDKIKRTVQWTDNKGDNLTEVLVYEPSNQLCADKRVDITQSRKFQILCSGLVISTHLSHFSYRSERVYMGYRLLLYCAIEA
ncbi:uncharacterized protein LOC130494568 isoform X2 [Raphanus sativus]|uniref:Uncharacterized protein LOC130494568 isoform X2 n=1 Tax=Raphanus sativus TaxID=3726 RepID=A0A9W3DDC4_RAPSA|nr:uncharacterized protein LOC130494568 isoform X2 [Raphanus sativus]